MDYSAANEWLCDGFERNSTLFLAEDLHESVFILLYELNKIEKKKSVCTQQSRRLSIPGVTFVNVGIGRFTMGTNEKVRSKR